MAKSDRFFDQCGPTAETPYESESSIIFIGYADNPTSIGNEFLYRELIAETRKTASKHYGSVA